MIKQLGLRTDHFPIEQPANSASFVLNAAIDSGNGDVLNYQNELGNELVNRLTYTPIGHININDDVVLFSTDDTTSEIGLFSNDVYTPLITTTCLGFKKTNLIKGEFKILNGCDRVIYWNDDLNSDKSINLDQLTDYQDQNGDWDCNLMKLNPDYLIPFISNVEQNNTGGNLEAGSYAFAIEILDDNLNSIIVGLATNYMPVYQDRTTSDYNKIYGNFSSSINTVEGGVATTSKSFKLTLSNLDTRFKFARILVSTRITGRGLAEEAYEMTDYLPIVDNELSYTFNSLANAVRTDIERLTLKNPKYTVSKDMEQVNGRLIRANVRTSSRDYSIYQRTANQIQTIWVRRAGVPEDTKDITNSKNPTSYFNGNTFIGDEVYALGIVYVYSDGSQSPVFHIPGRQATVSDLDILTIIDGPTTGTNVNVLDVAHLDLNIGDTIPRWKFFNTYTTNFSVANMAYYEGDNLYPETTGCDGELIYGDLAGTPIRHHKFPDRKSYPVQYLNSANQVRLNPFGVTFDNVVYPDADIVGHFFTSAIRTESEKTVIDQGIFFGHREPEDGLTYELVNYEAEQDDTTIVGITSPKTFMGLNTDSDYLSFLRYYTIESFNDAVFKDFNGGDISIGAYNDYYNLSTEVAAYYRQIVNQVDIEPNSVYNGLFDLPVSNLTYSSPKKAIEMSDILQEAFTREQLRTVSLKRNIKPYENLYNLRYRPITNLVSLADNPVSYAGDGFIVHFKHANIEAATIRDFGIFAPDEEITFTGAYYSGIWVETDVNYELIAEGTDCNTQYSYPDNLANYFITKVADFNGTDWDLRTGICQEYYGYNLDYQPANPGEVYLPIFFNYDYCSLCLDKFPNRIIWSPKSFSEEITDSYKINLVNDYVVVGENKGEITNIHFDKNRMLVLTEATCLIMAPNPQVINTDIDTAYIGTGDFLGVPPAEFSKVDYGFGGCQGRVSLCNTEYGLFWVDQKAGRIFQFDGNLEEISSKQYGNYNFFRENLATPRSGDSTVYGTGVQLTYDPYYKRVILHKSDFNPLTSDDKDYGNTTKYENLSFTMSYSPELKMWLSYHSWNPEYMFSSRTKFYTTESKGIWKHSKFNTSFYGNTFPFTVEYIQASPMTSTLEVVAFYSQTVDQSGLDKRYNSFNTIWCYSNNQSTGEQLMLPKSDYPRLWSNTTKTLVEAEENYRVADLRDISTGLTTTSKAWVDRRQKYLGKQGYVDKVAVNVDTNTNQWNLIPLRNKYHIIRLSYLGVDRLIFNLTETVTKASIL